LFNTPTLRRNRIPWLASSHAKALDGGATGFSFPFRRDMPVPAGFADGVMPLNIASSSRLTTLPGFLLRNRQPEGLGLD
jgi:hypothetical protein